MRYLIILLMQSVITIATAQVRSLDGVWAFKTDSYGHTGHDQEWFMPSCDISSWDQIEVPSCWNTKLPYSDYTGIAWYATDFTTQENTPNQDVVLSFQAVYSYTEVWLNGSKLGSHDFGFTRFDFDVTNLIRSDRPNRLVLKVDNSFKLGATWNWGGIRGSVELKTLPKRRVDRVFVASTPDLQHHSAVIDLKLAMQGSGTAKVDCYILDAALQCRAKVQATINQDAHEKMLQLNLPKANLWSFDTPYIYTARVVFTPDSGEPQVVESKFGVRKIEVDGLRLLLNGESVRLNGANYVPYDRFGGSTIGKDLFKRDIDLMKSCGVNMARLSHLALPEDVLDYIDSKGILIFEEIPLWNKNHDVKRNSPVAQQWLKELITERYNHPCIIGWSVGNEIGRLSDNPDIKGYISSAFQYIKKNLDSTRLTVYVTHTAAIQRNEPVLLSDLIMFNQYGAHGKRADIVHRNYPGKPIFYSEYGTKVNGDDINNSLINYKAILDSMRGRDFLIGASVWTFNDYRSNYRDASTSATQNRAWGVVDAYGRPKRGYWQLQRENSPLRQFEMTTLESKSSLSINLSLMPRIENDMPAFEMRGYKLRICGYNAQRDTLHTKYVELPTLKIGSPMSTYQIIMPKEGVVSVTAELMSPVGYAIHLLQKHLIAPRTPSIKHFESDQTSIRVHFDRDLSADEYYVSYDTDKRSYSTIDNYIEIKDLEYDHCYSITLVAVNNAGQTKAEKAITVRTQSAEMPPVILHLHQQGSYIQAGYTSDKGDYIFEFEYGLDHDQMNRHVISTEFGACNLPVIDKDKDHYLRIRKRLRYGYASEWSQVYKVKK